MQITWTSDSSDAPLDPVIAEFAKQFERHPLVQFGELHGNVQQHAFLHKLLRAPAFICKADDIVVEFGNSRLQDVATTNGCSV